MRLKKYKTAIDKSCNNKKPESKSEHGIDICPVESRSSNSFSCEHKVCQGDGNVCLVVLLPPGVQCRCGGGGVGGRMGREA